ncbi:hypothetical protein SCLCIDRAFT_907112 [Scleroderma citrinum Foug A]|uniref:Uncharacterized protein n=1 Tax=Scleroderma citrinum Foug A TaxID=1036808 RepID=A0A0C3DZJ4_9AGAM|nr:hypothetical protein SCLCIDRAFT_907112 [Scleroderma citrinum Foug A]
MADLKIDYRLCHLCTSVKCCVSRKADLDFSRRTLLACHTYPIYCHSFLGLAGSLLSHVQVPRKLPRIDLHSRALFLSTSRKWIVENTDLLLTIRLDGRRGGL